MRSPRGAAWIAYGDPARQAMARSIETFRESNPSLLTATTGASYPKALHSPISFPSEVRSSIQKSRWAKVRLLEWSPFEDTVYIDADTRIYGDLSPGFEILADGWDLILTPSSVQDDQILWHLSDDEREATLQELRCRPLQLQAGILFVRRSPATQQLFKAWQEEWDHFRDQDQGALLRALQKVPVRVWLLGYPWNGGAIINHIFGIAREEESDRWPGASRGKNL